MFISNVLANITSFGFIEGILTLMAFVCAFAFLISSVTNGGSGIFPPSKNNHSQRRHTPTTPQRHIPTTPKYNKQSHGDMKQFVAKKNGQSKKYLINKYGELFEE